MYEKNGKYFADWTDDSGRRKRKSFTTKRAATAYEQAMKEARNPRTTRVAQPRISRRGVKKASTNTIATGLQSQPSSPLVVVSTRRNGKLRR